MLRAAFTPTTFKVENVGEVHEEESLFRILVVSEEFKGIKSWGLRQKKFNDAITAGASMKIDLTTLWGVPLTKDEFEGNASVPVQCCQVPGGIGVWDC